MSKPAQGEQVISLATEGPVRLRAFLSGANSMMLEMGIDYEKAEVPDRSYYADYCTVIRGRVGVTLIFGRLDPDGKVLRTQVEIAYPEGNFFRQLWQGSRELHKTVKKQVGPNVVSEISPVATDKIQSFRANNAFLAVLGDDAVIDFYYISPGDVHFVAAKKRREVHLDPVIRIALNSSVMLDFLEQCKPIADEVEQRLQEHAEK